MSKPTKITVEVFVSPGCSRCRRLMDILRHELKNLPGGVEWKELEVVEHLAYATRLGIYSTPAVVINGKLKHRGILTRNQLLKLIQQVQSAENE